MASKKRLSSTIVVMVSSATSAAVALLFFVLPSACCSSRSRDEKTVGGLFLVDLRKMEHRRLLKEPGFRLQSVAFTWDQKRVALATLSRIYLVDWSKLQTITGREALEKNSLPGGATSLAFNSANELIAHQSGGDVEIWNLESKTHKSLNTRELIGAPTVSPDKGILAFAGGEHSLPGQDPGRGWLKLFDVATGKLLKTLDYPTTVNHVAFSKKGHLAFSGAPNSIQVYDLKGDKKLHSLEGQGPVSFVENDDKLVFMSWHNDAGHIRIFELSTRKTQTVSHGYPRGPQLMLVSPDQQMAITADGVVEAPLRIWDLQGLKNVKTFDDFHDIIKAMAISPDGNWLLVATWAET
jgi:WD40 repeat protein